jgi:hypothetical protein
MRTAIFLLRQFAKSNGSKDVFHAPPETAWIVQSTSHEHGKLVEHLVYLNGQSAGNKTDGNRL